MRHTRSGSAVHGMAGHMTASQKNSQRQGPGGHRTQVPLDSPPRLKQHRGGPSMSAERFLLIVAQLESRANELWEREQMELQRGAELMVICCRPPPPSPQPSLHALPPPPDNAVSSPVCQFEAASLLQAHAHLLHSPALLPGAPHSFQSPSWSNDFSAIAASLILPGPHTTDTSEEPPVGGLPSVCELGTSGHHGVMGDQHPSQVPWQPLGSLYDIEAHVTLPHGGGTGGTSARSAKARLLDRFDGGPGLGTATARHAQNADPFCCSFTPVADEFLESPSWARSYL